MTKEQLREALLRAMPTAGSPLRDILQTLPFDPTKSASSAGPVAPDLGQRDISEGPRKRTLDDELMALTRSVLELSRTAQTSAHPAESAVRAPSSAVSAAAGFARSSVLSQITSTSKGAPSLGSAFTLAPVLSGLIKLFGGGTKEEPDPLRTYVTPPPVAIEAAMNKANNLRGVSYGAGGQARMVPGPAPLERGPSVTVQVQAMDSRSFLDHSHEIATAVREALLSGHGLTDVFSEL
jgi:hypothetical protein